MLRGLFKRAPKQITVDLLSDAFIADPYPVYDTVHAAGGIVPAVPAGWLVTGHDRITRALSHPGFGNTPSRFSALNPKNARKHVAASVAANSLPFVDGARHQSLRKATGSSIFKAIQAFAPELDAMADAALKASPDARAFAGAFAAQSTLRFLGLPQWSIDKTRAFTDAYFRLFAPMTSAADLATTNTRLQDFRDAVAADISRTDTLFSQWCDHIDAGAAVDMTMLLLADGVENVEAGIQSGALALAARPELCADVRDWTALGKELLRWDSPAQLLPRVCVEDTRFDGHDFAAGTPVFLALGSANRDADVFDAPAEIQPRRDTSSALIFGAGRHSCIGQGLAVAQIGAGLAALHHAGRLADFEALTPRYQHRFGHRWPDLGR